MEEISINEVLRGSVNTDHEGTKRWRYVDGNGVPQYMSQNEFAEFFDHIVTRIQRAANSWKDE